MTRLRLSIVTVLFVAPLALASGCAQGLGDRCQVASDCATGLLCVLPAGATPQAGGTCQAAATDAGVPAGMTMKGD